MCLFYTKRETYTDPLKFKKNSAEGAILYEYIHCFQGQKILDIYRYPDERRWFPLAETAHHVKQNVLIVNPN